MNHFRRVDKKLFAIALQVKSSNGGLKSKKPLKPGQYFVDLCETIVSQQLSGKAALTIWNRVLDLFPSRNIEPQSLLDMPDEKIKAAGTSWAKVKFMKDLAIRTLSGELKFHLFPRLNDEEIVKELVAVKGIGPWTAEMFLMFGMGREDVFSMGDVGLKNAIKRIYGLEDPVKIHKLSLKWSPYRTWACRVLWGSLDLK